MFSKKEKKQSHLSFSADNLAVPEVHTKEFKEELEDEKEEGIQFDTLAIPEIRIKKINKNIDDKKDSE